jgi:hypothetical protein
VIRGRGRRLHCPSRKSAAAYSTCGAANRPSPARSCLPRSPYRSSKAVLALAGTYRESSLFGNARTEIKGRPAGRRRLPAGARAGGPRRPRRVRRALALGHGFQPARRRLRAAGRHRLRRRAVVRGRRLVLAGEVRYQGGDGRGRRERSLDQGRAGAAARQRGRVDPGRDAVVSCLPVGAIVRRGRLLHLGNQHQAGPDHNRSRGQLVERAGPGAAIGRAAIGRRLSDRSQLPGGGLLHGRRRIRPARARAARRWR